MSDDQDRPALPTPHGISPAATAKTSLTPRRRGHQLQTRTTLSTVQPEAQRESAAPTARAVATRTSRPRQRLPITNTPGFSIPTDQLTRTIMRSLLDSRDYDVDEAKRIAVFHPQRAPEEVPHEIHAAIVIAMQPGAQGTWKDVLTALDRLGDDIVDCFCAVLALALEQYGMQALTQPFWLSPDDVLALCQRKASNRAYLPEQRQAIIRALEVLAFPVVRAAFQLPRRRRLVRVESAIIHLLKESVTISRTDDGQELWQSRQVKIGDWAKHAPPLSPTTALMLRRVLAYHASRERTEKRLGRYLTLQFPQLPRGDAPFTCSMGELLSAAGIRPDLKNPRRARTMIESALARLRADGVIGAYQQIVPDLPTDEMREAQALIEESGRGWWPAYASLEWQFAPPSRAITQLALPLIAAPQRSGDKRPGRRGKAGEQ